MSRIVVQNSISCNFTESYKVLERGQVPLELNPAVRPVSFKENGDRKIEVQVHQAVKDLPGNMLFDRIIKNVYTIENGLIKSIEIKKP